ncbi:hypothetical protein FRC17_010746 [Serendipita sp. 399]|nr:hypothetical protein FRC17_010746 [Serendipita sp. 399]
MSYLVLPSLISAKGGGGRSSGGSGVSGSRGGGSDDWDAPPMTKALFAFHIIWTIATVALFLVTVLRLVRYRTKPVPRGPYILLAVVSFMSALSYILGAIPIRATFYPDVYLKMMESSFMVADFTRAFLPGVILWLVHIRGATFYASQPAGGVVPLVIRPWKRVVDWALVSATFVHYIAFQAYDLDRNLDYFRSMFDMNALMNARIEYEKSTKIISKLQHVNTTFVLLLAINVIASLIALVAAHRRSKFRDPVIRCLFVYATPFVFITAFMFLFGDIWSSIKFPNYNEAFSLASFIIDGLCTVGVITVVWWTIGLHTIMEPASSTSHLNPPSYSAEKA